jgi:hypothetical protein
MRGAQEPVALDGAQGQEVAGRELDARDFGALEARPAKWRSHRPTLRAGLRLGKAPAFAAHPLLDLPLHLLPRPAVALAGVADDREGRGRALLAPVP